MSTQPNIQTTGVLAVACTVWLDCAAKLKAMSHEHKATHEASKDAWERAYHLGAATAFQDARLEVLSAIIQMQSNAAPHLPPPGRQVERNKDIRTAPKLRAESAGGG